MPSFASARFCALKPKKMSVIIILMLASLAVGLAFVAAFVWSVRSGQYEDTVTPSMRVLTDDAKTENEGAHSKNKSNEH